MRFAFLGSGSRGNSLVVEEGDSCLLVDCGFSLRETERRLLRLGKEPSSITAVLVTHEHSDHSSGVGLFARRYSVPVWMTQGTRSSWGEPLPQTEIFSCHDPFAVQDIEVWPFPVPHDAREPSQFVFGNGDVTLGLLTDAGCSTRHIEERLAGCEALVIECNHDPEMLANGPYPPSLKARVGGRFGHLSNAQAAEILANCRHDGLRRVVAAHLSEKNNRPELARSAMARALDCEEGWVDVALQEEGLGWREV